MKKLCTLLLVVAATPVFAADETATPADPREAIAAKFPNTKPEQVRPSPVKGIFEVDMGGDTLYVSADGKFAFSGDLYDVETRTNLTEVARTGARGKALAKLDERDMIIFALRAHDSREAHHHHFHRRGMRLLPQVAQRDRPAQ
jgi:thiol:disulfide interchange protein DsbC